MTTTRATKKAATPEPKKATTPAKARATRKPTKSGDPRADRAAATKKAEAVTARAAKAVTPKAKPVTKKAATPKPDDLEAALIKEGWTVALTRNRAIAAYCKQRTLLHGAGPAAYRKATAKALGITDAEFLAAFYAPKAPKAKAEGK